jgi:Zn-finger nucleic acid-binding protein
VRWRFSASLEETGKDSSWRDPHGVSASVAMSALMCPACHCELVETRHDIFHLHGCPECQGHWVARDRLDTLTRRESEKASPTGWVPGCMTSKDLENVWYRPCLVCGELMNRRQFATGSGVVIDRCRTHGVWLDGQELERIIAFVRQGGLARAEKMDAEDRQSQEKMRSATGRAGHAMLSTESIPSAWAMEAVTNVIIAALEGW